MVKKLFSKLVPVIVLFGLVFSLTQPVTVYAEGELPPEPESILEVTPPQEEPELLPDPLAAVPEELDVVVLDENGEALPLASEEAATVLKAPDPYLTSGGVLYAFTADDCDPLTAGEQSCSNPIQMAVDFVASGFAPDDGTIYVENGTFDEYVTIDGYNFDGTVSLNKITSLNGSEYTTLYGGFGIYNMGDFTLNGFTIVGNVDADYNEGTLTLSDLDVSGADGNGISITNQFGDIVIKKVKSHNNYGDGLYINILEDLYLASNQALDSEIPEIPRFPINLGVVNISSSEFNQNMGNGITAMTMGDIFLSYVKANENLYNGAVLTSIPFFISFAVQEDNSEEIPVPEIYVYQSEFNSNGYYDDYEEEYDTLFPQEFSSNLGNGFYPEGGGSGLIAMGGNITLDRVTANGNDYDGANTMSFGDTLVVCSVFNDNDEYGLYAFGLGQVDLKGVTASGNGETDISANGYEGTTQVTYECKKVKKDPVDPGIPVTGENPEDTCALNGAVLELANLDKAIFEGLCPLKASLVRVEQPSLPGALPEGSEFGSSFTAGVFDEGTGVEVLPEGGQITISFKLTDEMAGKTLEIYYWDPAAEDGLGGWIPVPAKGSEGDFDAVNDAKLVLSGGQDAGDGTFNAIVNFSGTFIIVVK